MLKKKEAEGMLSEKGFDLWADGYDAAVGLSDESDTYPFAGYKKVLNTVFRTVMEAEKPKVLDLGFGTGTLTAKLYENGCEVYGQDFSERMIELAQKKMPDAVLVHGDLNEGLQSPLDSMRFDFIIATYSLHHLSDERKVSFIRELYGHLNTGGRLLIGDVAFRTRREMEECAEAAGEEWDEEEIYFVFEEMKEHFPALRFEKLSHCAGVLSLLKDH
jgi:putative AdoMet-dependent methyltransferase